MSFEEQLDFYPYGAQYHRAPTPLPSEWAGDLAEIKRRGYTHVQYRPQWRWHERVRGKPTWDDLDQLFELAQKNQLRVILKPQLETAPDWAFSELGGTRIGFHGVPISPFAHGAFYVGGWWPCFDNPEVVAAASTFTRALVDRYRNHPALWFYNAWNEPRSRPVGACHCEHSNASYRRWLKERFQTIERLNDFYGKAWTSFETIRAPESADDFAEMYLWRTWTAHSVAHQVEFATKAIRAADPKARVMAHVGWNTIGQDALWDVSNDVVTAKKVDRYGMSFPVPFHPKEAWEHCVGDLLSDWMRRVDPDYACHEFYATDGNWNVPTKARTLRRLLWAAIAGGAASLTHWQWRSERVGNETNGYGMRDIDGSSNERSEVCDEAAAVLARHGSALIGARRAATEIALLYSPESDLMQRLIETNDWSVGIEKEPNKRGIYKEALHGCHALYHFAGQTTDFVVAGDDLRSYRLLHVVGAELIDAKAAEWLRDYVRGGGNLIVEYPFAGRDDNTWVSPKRPTHALEDLIGCREADRVVVDRAAPAEATFWNGKTLAPSHWTIALAPTAGKAIATWKDGRAAAVEHSVGKGKVITLGVGLSLSARHQWTEAKRTLFRDVVARANVALPEGKPLWVRRRRTAKNEMWFVFNVHDSPGSVQLPAVPKQVWIAGDAKLAGSNLTLAPGETWVAEIPLAGL